MEYIILIVVLAVLLVGGLGGTFLLRGRSRGVSRGTTGEVTQAPPQQAAAPEAEEAGGGTATATVPAPAAPPAPPKPAVEKPPPSAGRMVRLRARLARSQS